MFVWSILFIIAAIVAVALGLTGLSGALLTVGYACVWMSLTMLLAFLVTGIMVGRETAKTVKENPSTREPSLPPV